MERSQTPPETGVVITQDVLTWLKRDSLLCLYHLASREDIDWEVEGQRAIMLLKDDEKSPRVQAA
jgi:hypothetical protein